MGVEQKTHSRASEKYCGRVIRLEDGFAEIEMELSDDMAVDEKGLIHGGFTFSSADYAAMLAVNHPFVVLAKAEVRFLRPLRVGDKILSSARVKSKEGKKIWVFVETFKKETGEKVLEGEFLCVIPQRHVLEADQKV